MKGIAKAVKRYWRPLLGAGYSALGHGLRESYGITAFAQEGEDMILRRFLRKKKNGFYIDVGACHPQRFSNTYYFYRRGWRGLNIDANPDAIALLDRHRPRDINLLAGVSDVRGTQTYYRFNKIEFNSFAPEPALFQDPRLKLLGKVRIEMVRLETLLERHLPPGIEIDFMSVDVEGHDLNVLQSNCWTRFRPAFLLVEDRGKTMADGLTSPISRYLDRHGYEPVAKTVNTFIYRARKLTGAQAPARPQRTESAAQ